MFGICPIARAKSAQDRLNERCVVEGVVVADARLHPRTDEHRGDPYPIAAEFGRIVICSGSGRNVVIETTVLVINEHEECLVPIGAFGERTVNARY